MKRSLPVLAALSLSVAFAACNPKTDISPDEILRRSIIRSHTFDSLSLSASAAVSLNGGETLSGSTVVQGVLQNGGTAWSLGFVFSGTSAAGNFSGKISAVTSDSQQYFLRPEELKGPLLLQLARSLSGSQTGWWVTGQPAPSALVARGPRKTPTPAELDRLASLFSITQSADPKRGSDGVLEYRLKVELTPDARNQVFPPAVAENVLTSGDLTIDAKDFTLRRAVWSIRNLATTVGPVDIRIDVTFKDYDRASPITIPSGSSATLPLKDFFATLSF